MSIELAYIPKGCVVRCWRSGDTLGFWLQHGDNLEARRLWGVWELFTMGREAASDEVRKWLESAHQREPCAPSVDTIAPATVS